MKSDFLSLKQKDALKGGILFGGTLLVTVLQQLLPTWTPFLTEHFGEKGAIVVQGAIGALLTYLTKNLFTDSIKQANLTLDREGITRVYSAEEIKAKEAEKNE